LAGWAIIKAFFCCLNFISLTLNVFDDKQAESVRGTAVMLLQEMFENGQLDRNI